MTARPAHPAAPGARPSRLVRARRLCRKLGRRDDGVAAIEFAMVGIPFFMLMFALLELGVMFLMMSGLSHGANEASRAIRLGSAQIAGASDAQFRQSVCDNVLGLLPCDANLRVDVRTMSNFSSAPSQPRKPDGTFDDSALSFAPGGPSEIVVVRVFYEWEFFTPGLGAFFADMPGNKRLLTSLVVFRNEPYG